MIESISSSSEIGEINPVFFRNSVIFRLRKLVEINLERNKEYLMAFEETTDSKLKTVFESYLRQSLDFMNSLGAWIKSYGGEYQSVAPEQIVVSKVRKKGRPWINLKAIFSSHDRDDILNSCEYTESIAISIYEKVLAFHLLPKETLLEITLQKQQIEKAVLKMISLSAEKVHQ
jgi:uncharacterized protein (TIGR02284 family)